MHSMQLAEPPADARPAAPGIAARTRRCGTGAHDDAVGADPARSAALRRACAPVVPFLLQLGAAASCLVPAPALAHVKWFAPFDVAEPPMPIHGVLTPRFLLVFAGFALLMAGGFLLDRLAARSGRGGVLAQRGREEVEERLVRAGTGAFFMALFTAGGVILTPELKTGAEWPAWLQLGVAASMLSARSCILGAAGILALYGYGAALYGAFHIADYPVFLGLAAYLALTSCAPGRWRALRMPVLHAAVCASLMWASVEKWAYPQWTFPLLEARPWLTFGILPSDFMVVAGFVEFAFAFHILTGFGLSRLGILGLGAIFAAAILDFGKLDAIGHLPILAAMAAMFVHGPTPLQRRLHDIRRGLLAEARRAGLAFAAAICVFVSAYYGLQRAEHGHGQHARKPTVLAEAPRGAR
ncbi:MAG: FIG00803019: hypothetical protein [uncultured Acetobacteraceae bacterium]|uniref:Uncharacterized protein n=1 Tax=uncultured Acetobacteraceae bacterium TaxID=169975 RepID=A0A6J4JTM9_9PROT|nr:MAG: FIG00803019: hypothetical protein [uncultured Acetobacteraceae bacterium]